MNRHRTRSGWLRRWWSWRPWYSGRPLSTGSSPPSITDTTGTTAGPTPPGRGEPCGITRCCPQRAGLRAARPGTYYIHHPVLTHQLVTLTFAVFRRARMVRPPGSALPAFASLLLVAAIAWRWMGPAAGALAALVFAITPVNVWYSVNIDQGFPSIACLLAFFWFYSAGWRPGAGHWRAGGWPSRPWPVASSGAPTSPFRSYSRTWPGRGSGGGDATWSSRCCTRWWCSYRWPHTFWRSGRPG